MRQLSEEPREYSFKQVIPMYNIIGDLKEYQMRKKVLNELKSEQYQQYHQIVDSYNTTRANMMDSYNTRCQQLQEQFIKTQNRIHQSFKQTLEQRIGHDYREFIKSYQYSYGHMSLKISELKEEQVSHKRLLNDARHIRKANTSIQNLIQSFNYENDDVKSIFNKLQDQIRDDISLKNKQYVQNNDVLSLLKEVKVGI